MTSDDAPVNDGNGTAIPVEASQATHSQLHQKPVTANPERDEQRGLPDSNKNDKDTSVEKTGGDGERDHESDRDNDTLDFDIDFKVKGVDLELSSPTDVEDIEDSTTMPREHHSSNPSAPQSLSNPELRSQLHDTSSPFDEGASMLLTLLLTTGPRYPFRITMGDLKKKDIQVTNDDPYQINIKTLKGLILDGWREEWDGKPPSSDYIRLISFGKLLEDESSCADCKLSPESPNVVHMTIRPSSTDEQSSPKAKPSPKKCPSRTATTEENVRDRRCRCTIL